MSKPDLTSLYKLEFYRKQDNWRLASKPRSRGKEKCTTSAKGDFNKTYVLSNCAANIATKLNDAFVETEPDSPAEDNGHGVLSQKKTLTTMNSFNELSSNAEETVKEEQAKSLTPPNSGSPTPETIPKNPSCISPSLELPNIFLPNLPLHTDLWSEKVDSDLNECNNAVDPTPQLQLFENNATTGNILVNLMKKHTFFIKGANIEPDAQEEYNENPPQGFEDNNLQGKEQEDFNRVDIQTKLKQKILRVNLLNNNYLIPNANRKLNPENNDFDSYFHKFGENIENRSLHEKKFELTNQEQKNLDKNIVESTRPTTLRTDLQMNENFVQMRGNNADAPNFKKNVKPFKNINKDFQYVPTDLTENSQNCYLNQNIMAPHNQYIINNYKPIFINDQKFQQFLGDFQSATKYNEALVKNCHIFSKNYHPEEVTKNFQNDAKSFQIDANNFKINPTFQNDANNFKINPTFQNNANNYQRNPTFQNDAVNYQMQIPETTFRNNANNYQFDKQSGNTVDHNLLYQNPTHQNLTNQNPLVHRSPAPYQSPTQQNPSLHQNPTLPQHNQIPQNHQIFRNPQQHSQITCDPEIKAYPEDHCDPCFEWTENYKEQVLDDIDGIWSEGREALSNATEWFNLAIDEENLNPHLEQICAQMEDLNMNTTSSTDSVTFMRGAALVPHSSEISLTTATDGCRERNKLSSLDQRHSTALKSLLSANTDNSLCIQTPSSTTQQKMHSATNTTPYLSCDYYPKRDVRSNTPLIDPINPTASGDFDAKLDQLREKLAQDQVRFENCAADQKLYTVFSKFQQYNECPSLEVGSKPEQQFQLNQVQQYSEFNEPKLEHTELKLQQIEHNFQSTDQNLQQVEYNFHQNLPQIDHKFQSTWHRSPSMDPKLQQVEHTFQSTDRHLQQVEHNYQSTYRKLQQVEHNFDSTEHNYQSTEHNQQIEHKSGHHSMRTVNKIEMGIFKQTSTNFGPYYKRRRLHSNNNFNYLSNTKVNQINDC